MVLQHPAVNRRHAHRSRLLCASYFLGMAISVAFQLLDIALLVLGVYFCSGYAVKVELCERVTEVEVKF